jgi:GNAT superfamily N-acetyltransferase
VDVRIRPAEPLEGERLREIAVASKQYWGYDHERVRQWAATLGYSGKDVHVAEAGGEAVAYAVLIGSGETAILDELWVEPEWIGKGVGSRLFRFVADRAAERGASRLEWESEPNAVGFYERLGARYLRDSEPSQWGRILPVMGIDL